MKSNSIQSKRLSVGDTIIFPRILTQKYAMKDIQYMVLSNCVDWETFPCAVITQDGRLFFFAEYEIV